MKFSNKINLLNLSCFNFCTKSFRFSFVKYILFKNFNKMKPQLKILSLSLESNWFSYIISRYVANHWIERKFIFHFVAIFIHEWNEINFTNKFLNFYKLKTIIQILYLYLFKNYSNLKNSQLSNILERSLSILYPSIEFYSQIDIYL